jgi:N-acetylneuraminate synthase
VHSVSLQDLELRAAINRTGLPVSLGVGGRTLDEIAGFQDAMRGHLRTLIYGFQAFPTRLEDLKLGRLRLLRDRFPDLQLGYAEHGAPDDPDVERAAIAALCLGAKVFEWHVTLDPGAGRVDAASALEVHQLRDLAILVRRYANAVFASDDALASIEGPEQTYRDRQRVAVAAKAIEAGHVLRPADISWKMTGRPGGLTEGLVDSTLRRAMQQDEMFEPEHLQRPQRES